MSRLVNVHFLVLTAITIVAFFLRFYDLPATPPGYTWDEMSITYNAWSIQEWRRDENAIKLPLSFKSFGDYKPPAFIYWMAGIFLFVPLDPFYTRLMAAVFGFGTAILSGLLTYSFCDQWVKLKKDHCNWIGLASFGLVAISPWSVHLSRIGFEQNMTLFFLTLGTWLLTLKHASTKQMLLGVLSLVVALYTFHTAKVVVPLLFIWLILSNGKSWWVNNKKVLMVGLLMFGILNIPLLWDSAYGKGLARAENLIFTQQSIGSALGDIVFFNITEQLSPSLWLLGDEFWNRTEESINPRNSVRYFSLMYPLSYYLLLGSLVLTLILRSSFLVRGWFLFLIAQTPALIGTEMPNTLRSSWAVVPAAVLISYTAYWLLSKLNRRWVKTTAVACILLLYSLAVVRFSLYYFSSEYEAYVAKNFQYGYKELFDNLRQLEIEGQPTIISGQYGQPYIYALVYNHIHPQDYQFGALNKYKFSGVIYSHDLQTNALYAASPLEIDPSDPRVVRVIKTPKSETIVWVIAKT